MNIEQIISIEIIHSIVTYIWGLICLLMGVILFVLNTPENETLKIYRESVHILSINYLILSLLLLIIELFNLRNTSNDVFPFTILLISTSQSCILPYALISLFSPNDKVKKSVIYYNVIPLLLLLIMYAGVAVLNGDPVCNSISHFFSQLSHPAILLRFTLLLFSIYQIVFYIVLIHKLSKHYSKYLQSYYTDHISLKLKWAKKGFYFAILIGISAITTYMFKDILIDTIFIALFCIFYYLFALMFIQYNNIYTKHESGFIGDLANYIPDDKVNNDEKQLKESDWNRIKSQIIDQKLYLQSGITVKDMCELFNTNRTSFSLLLNRNEKQSFCMFINQLRIEHAKFLLLTQSELTIAEISQLCGFTEQSNFTRQFKLLCNETPVAWVKLRRKSDKS
jgi:AraC-like DNA-binding protein